jgi:hypothetical protein
MVLIFSAKTHSSARSIIDKWTSGVISALLFFVCALVFCACAGPGKVVFYPEPESAREQIKTAAAGEIIESQNGPARVPVPEWVSRFLNGGIRQVEALGVYQNKYMFIARNRGSSFNALNRWAEGFSAAQDLPRLLAARVENRLLAAASLYPDDEYGEYFEALMKNISDADCHEARKEGSFWIKRRISGSEAEMEFAETENTVRDIYEFFVLVGMDKMRLQIMIRELMANTRTGVPPTRDQAASINRIQQIFFEGF